MLYSVNRLVQLTHLNSFLLEVDLESELFPEHDVGIVRLVERRLQLLQLFLGEDGAVSSFALGRRRRVVGHGHGDCGGRLRHVPRVQVRVRHSCNTTTIFTDKTLTRLACNSKIKPSKTCKG